MRKFTKNDMNEIMELLASESHQIYSDYDVEEVNFCNDSGGGYLPDGQLFALQYLNQEKYLKKIADPEVPIDAPYNFILKLK